MADQPAPLKPAAPSKRRNRKAAPPEAAPPADPPKPRWRLWRPDLSALATLSNDIRTLVVNLTVLVTILVLVPVIAGQFVREQVLIEPIAVPEAMAASGLSPEIAANRLWDGLQQVKLAAGSAKASVSAIPDSRQVSFSIPDSGLSIDSLIYYVRRFFNAYETRVSGEFRCGDPDCSPAGQTLRLRVFEADLDLIALPPRGERDEEAYFRLAAAEVMGRLDPFTAIAAQAETAPLQATVLARRLIRSGHPDAKWAHNLIGNMRMTAEDPAGALEEYRAALAIDPAFPQALANLGNMLITNGDHDGARRAFAAIEAANTNDPFAATGFAALAEAGNQPDEAIRWYIEASRRSPLSPDYLTRAGLVEDKRGNAEAAQGYWRQALEIDPGASAPLALLAAQHLVAERYAEAERLYRDAADYAPENADLHGQDADLLLLIERPADAVVRAERAIALDPDRPDYRLTRARALAALERREDALAELDQLERIAPNEPRLYYERGMLLNTLGRTEEAVAAMRRNLQLDPESQTRFLTELWIETWSRPTEPAPVADQAVSGSSPG
jgi:tetratricopeptide (TPR) repeat protein